MRPRSLLVVLPLPLLFACNSYPLFRLSGYQQESFNNKADVLFVVDNSPSMYDNSAALALNFNSFVDTLVDPNAGSGTRTETLSDAVTNFRNYISDTGRYLDYQLAVTTTSVAWDPVLCEGTPCPGTNGLLGGDVPLISEATTDDIAQTFKEALLCDLTAWPEPCGGGVEENCIPYDPNYVCGEPANEISMEYLWCVCGKSWQAPESGSGTEEGLLAGFMALCRAAPDVVAADPALAETCAEWMDPSTSTANEGFLREDSSVIIVIVTDEGDSSGRLTWTDEDKEPHDMFSPADSSVQEYIDLLDRFDRRISFGVVGPYYKDGSVICNTSSVQGWAAERYQNAALETNGFYNYIVQPDTDYSTTGDCVYPDFSAHLGRLGDLLNTMLNVFPLESVPDPETIMVYVDDTYVVPAECLENCDSTVGQGSDDTIKPTFSDGWLYDSSQNAVVFTGLAVPSYNAEVRIYYHPLGELPRALPF